MMSNLNATEIANDIANLATDLEHEIVTLRSEGKIKDAVIEDFKQFAAYLAIKTNYDFLRKTDEYAAFFDNLAKLENSASGKQP